MEYSVTNRNLGLLCRVCLTTSKNLIRLDEKIEDFDETETIHAMLEKITFSKVILDDEKFPSNICQMCLSFMKIGYEFQIQFKKSQQLLEESTNKSAALLLNEYQTLPMGDSPAPVEIIIGGSKFDLKDLVIVEDEETETEKFSYCGFLKNLGNEISATFINKNEDFKVPLNEKTETSPSVGKFNNNHKKRKKWSNKNNDLDISKLTVEKFPEENKIIIRQDDKVIRTLFECNQCKKVFTSNLTLQSHIESIHLESPKTFICDKCGHIAKTRCQLYHHLIKHSGITYQCTLCDKKYDSKSHLNFHLQKHKNERRYLCTVCGKNFNYSVSLKYHMRLHGEKQLVCNICGLKFRMPNTLKRHIRTHTKEKPYPCDYCDKRFSSRGEKTSHEMIHTGERPYQCQYCGKEFIKSVNLQTHCLNHSGPHQCPLCSKTFIDMKYLKIHCKKIHSEYDILEIELMEC